MEEKKLEFNKTYLEAYQIGLDDLELFRKELSEKHQEIEDKFNKDNAEMIERINKLSEECGLEKIQFKEMAAEEYQKTGNKKLICGLGIRVGVNLVYEETQAFDWAKSHKLCLALNKKEFEKIAKTQEIGFVKKEEKITVTFPKKIKVEEVIPNE